MLPDAFRQIAELLPEPTLLLDEGGRVIVANSACANRLQLAPDALEGRRLHDLVLGDEAELTRYLRLCCRSRQRVPGSLRFASAPEVSWRCDGALVARDGRGGAAADDASTAIADGAATADRATCTSAAGHAATAVDADATPKTPPARQLMLRLVPQIEAVQHFAALNAKIEELGTEIQRRREVEADLRAQRERLRITLDSIGDAVIVTDAQARVTMLNPVAQSLTGWGSDALDRPLSEVFVIANEFTGAPVSNPVDKVLREGVIVGLANHTVLISRDGSQSPIADSAAPIRDQAGEVIGVVLVFRDVSDEREAGAALRASEERLRIALEAGRMGTWEWDMQSNHVRWSPGLERLHGLEPGTFPGTFEAYQRDMHPDDRSRVLQSISAATVGQQEHHVEYRIILPDGQTRWVEARGRLSRPGGGDTGERLVGVCMDITDRKAAEEHNARLYRETQESELRFRQLADSMPQMVWAARPDGHVDYFNRRWCEYLGTAQESSTVSGDALWQPLLHPDDLPRTVEAWQQSVQSGLPYEIEYRLRNHQTGSYGWFLGRALPVRNEAGEIIRWFGTCTDIEAQKRAEQASRFLADASAALAGLRDPESTLRRVASLAVPDFADWCTVDLVAADGTLRRLGVAHSDPQKTQLAYELQDRYPLAADAAAGPARVLRTGAAERVPRISDELLRQLARDEEHLQLMRSLQLQSCLCVPLIVQGRVFGVLSFWLAESGRQYTAQDQKMAEDLAHRAAIAIDNARLYAELKEADRRKNEFLAMLAHELRNPLAPIRGGLDLLGMEGRDDETLQLMREQVEHLVRLVDDLLDVSRIMRGKISLRKEPLELSQSMKRAAEMTRTLFQTQRHQLQIEMPDQPVWIQGDAVRLTQVLINLLNNAGKYTDPGGKIYFGSRRIGDGVEIRVRDNGMGMDAELLPRIFDLFIQADRALDRSQGGLGIGLTLVQNLVTLHGGTVSAASAGIGKGSEFVIRLPIIDDPNAAHSSPQQRGVADPRRIVVVDDNQGLALILSRLLEKLGNHSVVTAHDGPSALDAVRRHRPEIVFLDIGLPLMDGYEVAQRLRAEGFDSLLLIAMTGYGQAEDRQRSMEAGFDVHMVKPADIRLIEPLLSHAKLQRQGC